METDLAYSVTVGISAYGPGGSVTASFLCSTEEKARKLEALLKTMAQDDAPDWSNGTPAVAGENKP